MTNRILSGAVCALSLFLVTFLSGLYPFTLNLVISLISCLASYEILMIRKEFKLSILAISSIIFSSMRSLVGPGTRWHAIVYVYAVICLILAMGRFIKNRKKSPDEFKSVWDIWFVFFLNIIVSVALGTIVEIRDFGKNLGTFLTILSFGVPWMCDMGAYFFGKKFGKHKLCPCVSPQKTIEGAIGGVFFSLISTFIFCAIYKKFFGLNNVNYFTVLCISALGAPVSVLGDLCFSLIKRLLTVKDFSDIIPGHGGILDRFDSVIFFSPFMFIFIHFFDVSCEAI